MDSNCSSAFVKEAAAGMVGDILTGSFVGSLSANAVHQAKGIKEALKAGATLRQSFKANPLPLGKEWKFKKVDKSSPFTNDIKFEIPIDNIHTPYETDPYKYHLENQRDLAKTLGMIPAIGVSGMVAAKAKKNHDNKMQKTAGEKTEYAATAIPAGLSVAEFVRQKSLNKKGLTSEMLRQKAVNEMSKAAPGKTGKFLGKIMGNIDYFSNKNAGKILAAGIALTAIPMAAGVARKPMSTGEMSNQNKTKTDIAGIIKAPYNLGRRIKFNLSHKSQGE